MAFYSGKHDGQPFALQSVARRFEGLTYQTLDEETRRELDSTFIQATIIRTDGTAPSLDAVYQIFERLKTGGTELTPHEIRVRLYSGPLVDFLASLNANPSWRLLYGKDSPRLRDQEIVLRFLALYVQAGSYQRPLRKFLNDFTAAHRTLESLPADILRQRFNQAVELILDGVGQQALRPSGNQVNAALSEALLVGLARRLDIGDTPAPDAVRGAIERIRADPAMAAAISHATAGEGSIRTRIAISTRAFATT